MGNEAEASSLCPSVCTTLGSRQAREIKQQMSQGGDIEIPLDVIQELSGDVRASPIKVSIVPAANTDHLVTSVAVQQNKMGSSRLPALSQHSGTLSPISHPHLTPSRLTAKDNFKNYKDTRVPYSVLRGYVYGHGQMPHRVPSVTLPGGPITNNMPNRGRRLDKNKEPSRRSRSECTVRADGPKGRQLLRMLTDTTPGTLPKIPADFCLVHDAGVECTCSSPAHKSLGHDRAMKGTCQLRDRLILAASRLGCHDILNTDKLNQTERENMRSEIVHGVARSNDKTVTSNERASRYKNGKYSLVKTYPPKQRTSSKNFINTWLEAGASVPKFVKPKHADG